jgi:Tfp pilus assembly protein PilO
MKPEEKKKPSLSIDTSKIKGVLLNFVVPLIAFAISLALILIIVYPYFKNLPVIKEELNQKEQLRRVLNDKLTNLNRMVDFKSVVEEDSNLVNQVLVNEAEVPRLLDEVNQIATDSGMDVTRLSYSFGGTGSSNIGEAKQVTYNSVSVALGTDSSYDQLIVFMKAIENAARFASVPNFRYSSTTTSTGESKLGGSFSIDSPYLLVQSTAVTDEPVSLDITSQTFVDFINKIKTLKYYEFLNPNIKVVKTETPAAPIASGSAAGGTTTPAGTQP